jgi:DNA-binding transcriptional LysR family regulator
MIDKLEMFIALVRERHFGRAAESIGVTQPTLSSAIRQLEDQLNVQLVHRGSRFQGLTPEGERVHVLALRIVGDMRALRDEMRAVRSDLEGTLRIGVIPTALPMVADLVSPYALRHPQVRFQIFSRTSAEILEQMDRLDLDAGITYLDADARRRRTVLPLYRERYRLLVAVSDPLAARDRVGWHELGGEQLCLLTPDMQNRAIVDRHLEAAGVTPKARIESNSIIALVGHVMTGKWASVVPEKLAGMFVSAGSIAAVPISSERSGGKSPARDEDEGEPVGLVMVQREPLTPLLATLSDVARQYAA